jgi:hypothetical protein
MLITVSDKGTVLKSQLGSGTNTTAAPSGSSTATAASDPLAGQVGGGSAEGSRGGSSSSSSSVADPNGGTSFTQGTSEGSSLGVSKVVAMWSGVVGLVVGGMFTLL